MTTFDKSDPTLFSVHHIGGRTGSIAFPDLPNFSEDITYAIYDADDTCVEQIEDVWKRKNVTVLPYCLADKCGQANFFINYCPYTSSLYPMDTRYGNFYHKILKYDYVFEFALKTEKIINLNTITLDSLVENGIVTAPDFLSIDTQGAELPILLGAKQCLSKNTVAVLVEINFVTLYEGAPLFGELDEFLRKNNFILADITPFNIGYRRIPELFRGKAIPLQGEALYLLRPDAINGTDTNEICRKLDKLAFAACAFGYTELAFEALERSANIGHNAPKSRSYQVFLGKLYKEMGKKTLLPPLWHEKYSFEESNNRFAAHKEKSLKKRILNRLKNDPINITKKIFDYLFLRAASNMNKFFAVLPIQILIRPMHTSFETFLIRNGFHLAAYEIRERRHKGR
ncbi:MAG: FkbM family methyltransferase [Bacteroidia bacterium]|nr:FkbM family methyltransferase [Bacteroidia bacterium]